MGQERLNRVAILAFHHEQCEYKLIAKDFVEKNDYRLELFFFNTSYVDKC
jgi:hypothetical protein